MKTSICFFLLLSLASCGIKTYSTPEGALAIPVQLAKPDHAIDVFYENQSPTNNFSELGDVHVEQEVPLVSTQTQNKRMLYRGNSEDQKKALLDQLIVQAVAKGASALVRVRYQYYTSATHQGYKMQGVAVKYISETSR